MGETNRYFETAFGLIKVLKSRAAYSRKAAKPGEQPHNSAETGLFTLPRSNIGMIAF
jgi:hypothetical protein